MTIETNTGHHVHLIPGYHAVKEALAREQTHIYEIWISEKKRTARIKEIGDLANERHCPVLFKEPSILDNLLPGVVHQGFLALAPQFAYTPLEDLISLASRNEGGGLILVADHITDEGNLGAVIRSAVFFGVNGLILPKDRSADITETVKKRSSGAYIHLPVTRVVNLGRALDILDKNGFWIIGTDEKANESIYDFDWNRDLALILGSEERGLSQPARKRCHQLVSIPSTGSLSSLNVSVSAGIILSEIVRQRHYLKKT